MFVKVKEMSNNESGQGITEYGAILAFVALIIALVFGFRASFESSLSNAFSSVATQVNSMAAGGSNRNTH